MLRLGWAYSIHRGKFVLGFGVDLYTEGFVLGLGWAYTKREVCVRFGVGLQYTQREVCVRFWGGLIHRGVCVRFWVGLYKEGSLC